jgi:hypothetical protein
VTEPAPNTNREDQLGIVAATFNALFRRECVVTAEIAATPETIWRLLTDADDMVRWNSTLTSMAGAV